MFSKLRWWWYCRTFDKRYNDPSQDIYYTNWNYFTELVNLVKMVPDYTRPLIYQGNTIITTFYNNIEEFADSSVEAKELMLAHRPLLRNSLLERQRTIGEFLENKDGYGVEYWSGVNLIIHELQSLYDQIRAYPDEEQPYYFRQLKEVFLSGLRFLHNLVRGVRLITGV